MEPELESRILEQKIIAIQRAIIDRLQRENIRPTVIEDFNAGLEKILGTEFHINDDEYGYFVNGQSLPREQIYPFVKKVEDRLYKELDKFLRKEAKERPMNIEFRGNKKKPYLKEWKGTKTEFSRKMKELYKQKQYRYKSLSDTVKKEFLKYTFQDKKWTAEKCYDLAKRS